MKINEVLNINKSQLEFTNLENTIQYYIDVSFANKLNDFPPFSSFKKITIE